MSRSALVERWRDPAAPESCELDSFGEVELSLPPSFRHQIIVMSLGRQLEALLGGQAGSFALATDDGVRFPDLCWAPDFQHLAAAGQADPLTVMPPLCIEVLSPGNPRSKVIAKVRAYIDAGVIEVWLVELDGRIRWFRAEGELEDSLHGVALIVPRRRARCDSHRLGYSINRRCGPS